MADSKMAYVLPDQGVAITFDSVLNESHTGTSIVTSHPVEKGVKVSDHVRKEPPEVTLTVLVTNTPNGPILPYGGSTQPKLLDVPHKPKGQIDQAVEEFFDDIYDALGIKPPPLPVVNMTGFPTSFDKIADTHAALLTIKNAGGTCLVITSTQNYSDMILTSVGMSKDEKGSATFTITFVQIYLADSKNVTAPKPMEPRGKPKESAGNQGVKETKQSLASKAIDAAKGALGQGQGKVDVRGNPL